MPPLPHQGNESFDALTRRRATRSPNRPAAPQPQQTPVGRADPGREDRQSIPPQPISADHDVKRSPCVLAVEQLGPPPAHAPMVTPTPQRSPGSERYPYTAQANFYATLSTLGDHGQERGPPAHRHRGRSGSRGWCRSESRQHTGVRCRDCVKVRCVTRWCSSFGSDTGGTKESVPSTIHPTGGYRHTCRSLWSLRLSRFFMCRWGITWPGSTPTPGTGVPRR